MVKKVLMECDVCHKTFDISEYTEKDGEYSRLVMKVFFVIPPFPDLKLDMCGTCRKNTMVYLDQFLGLNLNVQ